MIHNHCKRCGALITHYTTVKIVHYESGWGDTWKITDRYCEKCYNDMMRL